MQEFLSVDGILLMALLLLALLMLSPSVRVGLLEVLLLALLTPLDFYADLLLAVALKCVMQAVQVLIEYACGLSGYLLEVNPFDQPGVEAYKKNMFALLGKPGYEDRKAELEAKLGK